MVADDNKRVLIFLVEWPVTYRERDLWGFNTYLGNGFEIKVFDLSLLLNADVLHKHPVEDEFPAEYVYKIDSYATLEKLIAEHSPNTLFADQIGYLSDITWKHLKLFRLLKKYDARYIVVYPVALPQSSAALEKKSLWNWLITKLRMVEHIDQLIDFFVRKVTIILRRKGFLALPERIYCVSGDAVGIFLRKYSLPSQVICPIHSFDYDTYLRYKKDEASHGRANPGKCAVFLEEGLASHSDWDLTGIKPLNRQRYFSELHDFFTAIENDTGLQVIIAAHPRSKLDSLIENCHGREVVQGKTVGLVAVSSLVIAHYSTALNFAVLFGKPVLLVKTSEMGARFMFNSSVDCMADSLGVEPISTGNELQGFLPLSINKDKYEKYRTQYIAAPNLPDLTVAQVVIRDILTY